ncbi:MAG: hypothetical protein AB2810_05360 [Candidatus Thiodiazotropha endolucinida]
MTKLKDDLKRVLSGLTHQDVGDYLPIHDKMSVLGFGTPAGSPPSSSPVRIRDKNRPAHRIALLSDGRENDAPLDYVIDTSLRLDAKIDLLIHGEVAMNDVRILEAAIESAGIEYRRILLETNIIEGVLDYIQNQNSLLFLVGIADDSTIQVLIERVIPNRTSRIPIPLVLIDAKRKSCVHKLSAVSR